MMKEEERLILGQPIDGWISGLDWASYVGEEEEENDPDT